MRIRVDLVVRDFVLTREIKSKSYRRDYLIEFELPTRTSKRNQQALGVVETDKRLA